VRDPLREGLRFPDERLESLAQGGSRYLVESGSGLQDFHRVGGATLLTQQAIRRRRAPSSRSICC
jgi:hypothetical protein